MTSGWFGRQGKQGSRVGELLTKAHFPGSFHSYLEQEMGGTLTSPSSSVHACSLLVLLAEGTPEGLLALAPEA